MPSDEGDLFTPAEAASVLGVSPDTVRRMADKGEVERVYIGRKVLYRFPPDLAQKARGSRPGRQPAGEAFLLRQALEALEREQKLHAESVQTIQVLAAQVGATGILVRHIEQITRVLSRFLDVEGYGPPAAGGSVLEVADEPGPPPEPPQRRPGRRKR